jgi:hypothetical protein
MTNQFQRLSRNSVLSSRGFKVTLHLHGGVDYSDGDGDVRVDSEILVEPSYAILLYPRSRGLIGIPQPRADQIVRDITEALDYLGHQVEISDA